MQSTIDIGQFEKIYKQHYKALLYFAYGFVGEEEASKDIVSDTFTKMWQKRDSLDLTKIEGLLFTIVRNESIKYLRRKKTNDKYLAYCKVSESEEDESYFRDMEERIAEMQQVIETLPPRTKFILEECCYNNHTYNEVAEILDISPSGVKKNISKAYAILREHFKIKKK